MQETIKLLGAIDMQIKRQSTHGTPKNSNNNSINLSSHGSSVRKQKFPYARILDFGAEKYTSYPKWLTQRQDFLQFMYQKYESKLLSIPKICEKQEKASDEKYFISLYLQQIPIFQNLPHPIKDIMLDNIKTKYYSANSVIHEKQIVKFRSKQRFRQKDRQSERQTEKQEQTQKVMQFMAVIFVGSVTINRGNTKIVKVKNDVIMTQAFYNQTHPEIVANQETVLLTFHKSIYPIIQQKLMDDINQKSRDQIADLIKSDFFIQLHLKDKKAKSFFSQLKPEFYFRGEHVCNAGDIPQKFYIIFRGCLKQLNHIHIREYNKWPLNMKRYQVRAVYNAFQNSGLIKQYSFFGDEQIINTTRLKATYIAETHSILFSMDKDQFIDSLTNQDFKRLKKYRNEHININYSQFQKSIRQRVKSIHQKKKIIHKAIDTSFINRNQFPKRRISLVQKLQKNMLTTSILPDLNSTLPS